MQLGLIANEFPPGHGGMQEHALGVARHFSREHDLVVFTSPGNGIALPNVTIVDVLTGDLSRDAKLLASRRFDAWLTLSAGCAAYAPYLNRPIFAYVHGNDFICPWFPKAPVWLTRTEALSWRLARQLEIIWRKHAIGVGLRRATHIFANSRYTRERCCKTFSIPPERVIVVAPGIDDAHFSVVPAQGRDGTSGPLKVLTVSRLARSAHRKNVGTVIEAVARLAKEFDVQYKIVGEGDDKQRLESLVERLGIAANVHFVGAAARDEIVRLYRWADIFALPVIPSDTDVEGFGMVYIEAAAYGLPSIASDCGGIPDAVTPATGYLLKNSTVAEVESALRNFRSQASTFVPQEIHGHAKNYCAQETSRQLIRYIEQDVMSQL